MLSIEGISFEESDNPMEWTTVDGRLIPSIEIPDTKKLYCFAAD